MGETCEDVTPKRRPSFAITFQFTDFTEGGNIDRDALAEALFDHLVEGDYEAADADVHGSWSIDSWEVSR